jgi:homoserine kinase
MRLCERWKRTMDHDFELSIPASSANLGPAFDAAALALSLFLHVRARTSEQFVITAAGRDAAISGNPDRHLIVETYLQTLAAAKREAPPLELHLENEIPIGRGCGSSAAAGRGGAGQLLRQTQLERSAGIRSGGASGRARRQRRRSVVGRFGGDARRRGASPLA